MSITNELREYADTLSERARYGVTISNPLSQHSGAPIGPTKETEELYAIADSIDAEHEHELTMARAEGVNKTLEVMGDGYIALPKDADGEYIHIGDMMENLREDFEPLFHHTFRVYGIQYREYGQECTLTEDGYPSIQYRASEVRHYHEPTVEDVLREFGDKYCDMVAGSDKERELFAEYAAKLQLKGQE